jgi:hypothetical protein
MEVMKIGILKKKKLERLGIHKVILKGLENVEKLV